MHIKPTCEHLEVKVEHSVGKPLRKEKYPAGVLKKTLKDGFYGPPFPVDAAYQAGSGSARHHILRLQHVKLFFHTFDITQTFKTELEQLLSTSTGSIDEVAHTLLSKAASRVRRVTPSGLTTYRRTIHAHVASAVTPRHGHVDARYLACSVHT